MRKYIYIFLLVFFLIPCTAAASYQDTPASVRLSQTASGRNGEHVTDLSDGWRFGGSGEDASAEDYNDALWNVVNLPHTWNAFDTADGNKSYNRTYYWYRKTLDLAGPFSEKRYFLEFLGVNQQTDVYVNGQHICLCGSEEYTHKGGYTAFRYDITDALRPGNNQLAVRVDNTYSEEIAPLDGDFNIYGGIYRRVFLITVNNVHFDLADHGSSGLFLTTPNVRSKELPTDFGTLNIRAAIVNDGPTPRNVTVTAHIDGDNAPSDIIQTINIAARKSVVFDENVYISNPHLWNGIDYSAESNHSDVGYQYHVTLTICEGIETLDTVSDRVGFRYFYVDKETGFYLNGQPHPLRGVNRHQSKENLGNALIEADHELDMSLILEMGANTVRLAHYPHADLVYDLCDENGIILWTEIPLVNLIGLSKSFIDVTKNQLTELIRQQYNRPSVCFWGLENEVRHQKRNELYTTKQVLSQLDDLAHQEDPSGRYTTQAVNNSFARDKNNPSLLFDDNAEAGWKSDLIAYNIYPGWYGGGTFQGTTDNIVPLDSRPMGLSEYGWGASTTQHELYPFYGPNGIEAFWHPEEYQSKMHEQALAYINTHHNLWGTFVWNMFDFNVDWRNEGSTPGQNDKGLVTNDRKIKKDSFYLYKANWNKRTPFVHITSARFTPRDAVKTYVKVYSNCDSVVLYQNGTLLGNMTRLENGVFMWEDMTLSIGENKIHAVGTINEQTIEDTCLWFRSISPITALQSELLSVSLSEFSISLPRPMMAKEVKNVLYATDNGSYRILSEGKEVEDDEWVLVGMKAAVVSESGKEQDFTFAGHDLLAGKNVTATSSEQNNPPENTVDRNSQTRWAAINNQYPQSITVDLGELHTLGNLAIDWYEINNRSYTYTVETSLDGVNFTLAADRRSNKTPVTTMDSLNGLQARYLRITVHSCSESSGYASLYALKLDGWDITSDVYKLDHENRLILVPKTAGLTLKELDTNLTCQGLRLTYPDQENSLIVEGSLITFMDVHGNTVTYTVKPETY